MRKQRLYTLKWDHSIDVWKMQKQRLYTLKWDQMERYMTMFYKATTI